jgi:hypothetical protein
VAAEEMSMQRELAALRQDVGQLRDGQAHLAAELERTRRELREDIRDLCGQVAAVQNGQLLFAGATVAGLLGVIATLIVTV